MKTKNLTLPVVALAGFVLAGCPADDAPVDTESTTADTGTTNDPTTTPQPTTDPDTTAGTAEVTTTVGVDTETGTTTEVGPDPYAFDETPFDQYTQVDRIGFPAVNTGLNLLGDKNAYNAASPGEDVMLAFLPDIATSLETLHYGAPDNQVPDNTGLDDDLLANGFTPCVAPPAMVDNCDDQGAPFVIPDVIELDLDEPAMFPNGRPLNAPVMDIILAVILLDLGEHDITQFVDFDLDGVPGPSVNPTENDVEFAAEFPYLAPAHE